MLSINFFTYGVPVNIEKDMEIWELVGLWHYPIPGFFILAQFCLEILVALGNLVNNSAFVYISNEEDRPTSNGDASQEDVHTKESFNGSHTCCIKASIWWGQGLLRGSLSSRFVFLEIIAYIFFNILYIGCGGCKQA
ncbi:putative Piezo family protein [Helianthus annuus]|nr:putative Piezo family protein [Helianthus annuus]